MKTYESIEKGIENRDIEGLREALGSICYTNRRSFKEDLLAQIKYVEEKGIKIKEDILDGKLVSEGKSIFTEDDFGDAVFELKSNFCDERIADVIKIAEIVYGDKETVVAKDIVKKSENSNPNQRSHQEKKLLAVGLILVAVVVALVVIVALILKD